MYMCKARFFSSTKANPDPPLNNFKHISKADSLIEERNKRKQRCFKYLITNT